MSRHNGICLRTADLSSADLRGAYLKQENFRGRDLRRADLREARLQKANLINADLTDALLSKANMSEARLSGATLKYADLADADMERAVISKADLSYATLRGADLSRAHLQFSNLRNTDFSGARLHGTQALDAAFCDANFSDAILTHTVLQLSDLRHAQLVRANMRNAHLDKADLRGANLTGASLCRASLKDALLFNANLTNTDLSRCRYSRDTAWPEGYRPPESAIFEDEEGQAFKALEALGVKNYHQLAFIPAAPETPIDFMYQLFPDFFYNINGRWAWYTVNSLHRVGRLFLDLVSRNKGDGVMPFSTATERYACIASHIGRIATPAVILARMELASNSGSEKDDGVAWLSDEVRRSMSASRRKAAAKAKTTKQANPPTNADSSLAL